MDKAYVMSLLMSMRNEENAAAVNNLLGTIDMKSEEEVQKLIKEHGGTEDAVRNVLENTIAKKMRTTEEKHQPINDMITYGITGGTLHLHLPGNLEGVMRERGLTGTMDLVNAKLLDALGRIGKMKEANDPRTKGVDQVFMISPILIKRELAFLEQFDFQTRLVTKKQLKDPKFVAEHPETELAIRIFGTDRNVGFAKLPIEMLQDRNWQEKKKAKIKEFKDKGVISELEEQK